MRWPEGGHELFSECLGCWAVLPGCQVPVEAAETVNANGMAKLDRQPQGLAGPPAAFLDFAKLDKGRGQVCKRGTPVLAKGGIECAKGGRQFVDRLLRLAELEVAKSVVALELGQIERANSDP